MKTEEPLLVTRDIKLVDPFDEKVGEVEGCVLHHVCCCGRIKLT